MNRKVGAACAVACAKRAFEVGRPHDAAHHWSRRFQVIQVPNSNGQPLAALGTSRTDDGATGTGFHTDKEAVRAGTASFGSLVGAFHRNPFPP